MNQEQVYEAVQQKLNEQHPDGVTLQAIREGIQQDADWWYVPVVPDRKPARRYEYYESLAIVENELQKEHNLTVLFVPTAPQSEK